MTENVPLEKFDPTDKRITVIILNHWEDARKDKSFPSEGDLDSTVLEEVLDSSFLVKTDGIAEGKYNYKYLGQNIVEAYGSDLTKCLDYSKGNPLSYTNRIQRIVETGRPISDEGQFINASGDVVKYRMCLVPLSSDGVKVDSVLGGMRFVVKEKE